MLNILSSHRPFLVFDRLEPHDHALLVYDRASDLRDAVESYAVEGATRNEITVFVHPYETDEEALRFLAEGRVVDFRRLLDDYLFLVSHYRKAFEGGADRIDHEHVVRVVDGIVASARERGRGGARIIVDASREYLTRDRTEEWFGFEEWLGTRLHHAVGLVCAYRRDTVSEPRLRARVLRTHGYRFGASL